MEPLKTSEDEQARDVADVVPRDAERSGGSHWRRLFDDLPPDDVGPIARAVIDLAVGMSCEREWEVWAPCAPHRMVMAANCESAARRYVRKHFQPGSAPREVFTRADGLPLRLVAMQYTTRAYAEVTP